MLTDQDLREIMDEKELEILMESLSDEETCPRTKTIYIQDWFITVTKSIFNHDWISIQGISTVNQKVQVLHPNHRLSELEKSAESSLRNQFKM